jgi:glyoxylase-like metal-dependent hydrolase (beta-lactamase superfamily II)
MIPYVRDFDFAYGRSDAVSPLIRRVIARNPGPFTFTGTGSYIVGHGEVAVIDPGPDLPEHLDALLKAVAGERVTAILVTHDHLDHCPLTGPLAAATGAAVIGARPSITGDESDVRVEEGRDDGYAPGRTPADGERIAGPGWTLRAVHTPGHTANHICFALEEEAALFSGDHIMGWSTTVVSPPDGDMTDYYASLEKVRAGGYRTLWPTHGPPVTDPGPFIDAYVAHRHEREAQILAQLAAGRATIAAMVPVIYAAVDRRLHPAAARSVLAHLIHLVRQGVVTTDGEPSLDSHFRPAAPPR